MNSTVWSSAYTRLHPFSRRWIDEILQPPTIGFRFWFFCVTWPRFFTCDDELDSDAKRFITITGNLTIEGLRTLVMTQISFNSGDCVEKLTRSSRTFEVVVEGWVCGCDANLVKRQEFTLSGYIPDVWAAITSFDQEGQFQSFWIHHRMVLAGIIKTSIPR